MVYDNNFDLTNVITKEGMEEKAEANDGPSDISPKIRNLQ